MIADLEKLLPCPFCGEPAKSYVSRDDDHDRYGEVCCTGCTASVRGPHLHWMDNTADEIASQFQAEMGWNRRAPAPVVPAEGLDALVKRAYRAANSCLTNDDAIIRELAGAITALRTAPPVGARVIAEKAYLAGFNAAGEGYNGEWPFHDKGISPDTDEGWLIGRDMALAALLPAGEGK